MTALTRRSAISTGCAGSRRPWKLYQNYLLDLLTMRFGALSDGTMRFKRRARST